MVRARSRTPVGRVVFLAGLLLLLPTIALGQSAKAEKLIQAAHRMMRSGDFKGAADQLEASVREFPTDDALSLLGECYEELKRYPEALAVYRRLLTEFGGGMSEESKEELKATIAEVSKHVPQPPVEEVKKSKPEEEKGPARAVVSSPSPSPTPAPPTGPIPLPDGAEPPRPRKQNRQPEYPASAHRAGGSGVVVLKVAIGVDGSVSDVQVVQGDEPFASSAVKTVKGWRYEPARYLGQPIAVTHTLKIEFRLK